MKKEIEISSYFIKIDEDNPTEKLWESARFSDWVPTEIYLKKRIELKEKMEVFRVEIKGIIFPEFNKINFYALEKIKALFLELLEEHNQVPAEEKKEKRSRIEIRIDEKEKAAVLRKCENIEINISEYTRQLYKYGEIRIVPEQFTRDIRGMAVNLNQIARKLNSGAVSIPSVIPELQALLSQLQQSYNNQ